MARVAPVGASLKMAAFRAIMSVFLCVTLLTGIMWTNVAPILRAFGQDEELSLGTQQYLRVLLLAAPGYIGFETLKKYLQCQGIYPVFLCSELRSERLTACCQL